MCVVAVFIDCLVYHLFHHLLVPSLLPQNEEGGSSLFCSSLAIRHIRHTHKVYPRFAFGIGHQLGTLVVCYQYHLLGGDECS